jgi:glycyl-tRNA synthetase beta chain
MAELLLELGCEELPASFVKKAYEQLEDEITSRLRAEGIDYKRSQSMGTPRRLIVQVQDVEPKQPDTLKVQKGPSLQAAYDAEGNPTKALLGFCRSQGAELDEISQKEGYVWLSKNVPGKPTQELLLEILPAAIKSLTFEKTMRWGSSRMRFARPIRWILACYDRQPIPFTLENIQAGLQSRGHRFMAPAPFEARSFEELLTKLRENYVEPDPLEREKRIRKKILEVSSGTPELTDSLVFENVFLTEWPSALEGNFPEEYLELPPDVLATSMIKHQRFFPVRNTEGKLLNKFISIRNGGVEDVVRAGNEWVLVTRFKDANFFYQQDVQKSFSYFLEQTARISFQEKLGSIRERATRLGILCEYVASLEKAPHEDRTLAGEAGLYCKADLSTGLVMELPELQGIIGGEYAKREGFADPICQAIRTHYDLAQVLQCAQNRQSPNLIPAYTLIADQVDKLVGYLGLDLAPTGSSDPFGLRRSATFLILVDSVRRHPSVSYLDLFEKALETYESQGHPITRTSVLQHLEPLFLSRYKALLRLDTESNITYEDPFRAKREGENHELSAELLDAAFSEISLRQLLDPSAVLMRLRLLHECMSHKHYTEIILAATRTINIVQAARKKEISVDIEGKTWSPQDLQSEEGVRLYDIFQSSKDLFRKAAEQKDACQFLEVLRHFEQPIHAFFESTLIMVDEEKTRHARLSLLAQICEYLFLAGDFSRLNPET